MARVIGMDVHRDFAQVVVLDGDQLRHFGRVRLDKDSLTTFADRLMPSAPMNGSSAVGDRPALDPGPRTPARRATPRPEV